MEKTELISLLQKGVYEITFKKVDGEIRVMPATLLEDKLPKREPVKEGTVKRKDNPDVLSVWCVDKNEWRSFKLSNFISMRAI